MEIKINKMTSATRLDYYFQLINNLTDNDKLELIARISTSLKQYKKKNTKPSPNQSLFGALDDDETAEAWITRIREHNDLERAIETQ